MSNHDVVHQGLIVEQSGRLPEKRLVSWLVIALALIAMAALLLPNHFILGLATFLPPRPIPIRFDAARQVERMPRLDGIALLRRLKSDDHFKRVAGNHVDG